MSLEIILGCMYSGKSTELIRRIQRLKSIGMKCCVINHVNDTRVAGDYVQTHDGNKCTAIKTNDLLLTRTCNYDVIAIDEGQFFMNLKTAVTLMLQKQKFVIVAGLNGDYRRKKFGEILDLVPMADNVTFKRALCKVCRHPGRPASFTKRLDQTSETISVTSKYISVCRHCYEN